MTAAAAASGPRLPPGWTLFAFERIGSTNDEAKRLARAGAAERTMVWARRQEAGRARRGRSWSSPEGNLYCTAVLRPRCLMAVAGQLSFAVALALHDALSRLAPDLDFRLKWPNDVLVGGRKVSGILLESESGADGTVGWIVAGTGVNLSAHPEDAERPATSLAAEGVTGVTAEDALSAYAPALQHWTDLWTTEGFAPLREAWLARACGVGGQVLVRLERETLSGTFQDLNEEGALVLRLDDGRSRLVASGDVFFAPAGGTAGTGGSNAARN